VLVRLRKGRSAAFLFFMTTQDILTIAVLLTVVLVALLFPGGPGTPKRLKLPLSMPAENWWA
jgi:hypothetical protein